MAEPYLDEKTLHGERIHITVRNRERVFYDDEAIAITSYNAKGKFDVLAEHVNFISIINTGITIHKTDGTLQEFKISTGVMQVSKNTVTIFLGILTQNPTSGKNGK
jgi:F0F1-type ATP synthase epsilon subunit